MSTESLLDQYSALTVIDTLDRPLVRLSASQVEEWLSRLRGQTALELPADSASYTPREVAKLLGVSLAAVRDAVKRHRLEAVGHGKKRRLPQSTVQALLDRQAQGSSPQTRHYYRAHLRSFGNWLVRDRRLGESPERHLEPENTTADRRHDRRALTADEMRRVLKAARNSPRAFRGLAGSDRFPL